MEHSPSSYTYDIFEACKDGFFQDLEQALLAVKVKLKQQQGKGEGEGGGGGGGESSEVWSYAEATLGILKRGLGHLLYEMRAHQLPTMLKNEKAHNNW